LYRSINATANQNTSTENHFHFGIIHKFLIHKFINYLIYNFLDENIYYIDLITRYLTGELDKSELAQLQIWLSENAANQETFDDLKKVFELVGNKADASVFAINVEDEWTKFQTKIDKQNESGKVISL